MALEIIKDGLAKNKIRGPFRPRGGGGSRRNGPRTISKYFFIFEPFPKYGIQSKNMVNMTYRRKNKVRI